MRKRSIFSAFRFVSLALGVALFLLVSVSSCTQQTGNGGDNQQSLGELESGRLVEHAMGETTVPEEPQRVVILTNEGTDMLLALGVTPVGAVQSWQGDPYYDYLGDQLDNVPTVGDELKPNLESIVALKPDLIIGSKVRQQGIYKKLKAIAPTIFSETIGETWKDNLKLYAEAVNREAEATSLMAAWDQRIEK
ncbi:MAG: ABC transporter substrate-binding protein, partial [Limnothrix sp. RL_2_0]|nr:ABC transporter substrate-binding protein [Limnothrix sp. RL_2_0]